MTFVFSALFTYGIIEWFARPTEAYAPPAPEFVEFDSSPLIDPPPPEGAMPAVAAAPDLASDLFVVPRAEPFGPPAPAEEDRNGALLAALHETEGPHLHVLTGRIGSGSTLNASLIEQGVSPVVVERIVETMRPVFDFRYAHPGDSFALVRDDEESVLSFEFQRGRRDVYRLRADGDGKLVASHEELPLERRVVRLSGVVQSSIFDTMVALGEEPDLVNRFTDIFAWDVDFSKETKPGDDFRMVFEKFFDRDGFVRYGNILAAQYRTGPKQFVALYFEEVEGSGDYYHPDGTSVRRSFLKAPLRYTRISSRYTKSRLHPILKVRRPHEGVDYVAPVGTPVWSVADGTVIFKGWSGGFGRLVKVRHHNGWISYYGHLSAYAETLRVGRSIAQQETVGYVGATGLASGPHLDYRLKVNGEFVDPLRAELPFGKPISVRNLARFAPLRDARLRELAVVGPAVPLASR